MRLWFVAAAMICTTSAQAEPTVKEVVDATLRNFRVHPELVDSLRARARTRALLPVLATGYRFMDDKLARAENQVPQPPLQITESANTRQNEASLGAVWDLRELVFSPGEVQVYGLVSVQRELMLEATRTYFLRKQLLLRRQHQPPDDAAARQALDLRIEEYGALLDVLTGGWFSEQLAKP